jgi:hypothetical protein
LLQAGIHATQHFLDGVYGLFIEKRFPTLLAYPGRHIINDEVVSSAPGGIANPLVHQRAFTVETFHAYLFLRVCQSGSHCVELGKYVVMIAR